MKFSGLPVAAALSGAEITAVSQNQSGTLVSVQASLSSILALAAQPATATPLIDGTATVGTSLLYARQDHVHPTDTTRAALAGSTSQTFSVANATTSTQAMAYGQFTSQLGVANGVATLDSGGHIPIAQIPATIVGGMNYQGTWNASTNTPTLASGTGTKGYFYKVSVAGTTTIDTISQWNVGDLILFDGTVWDKIDGIPSEVLSVAGRVGAVVLAVADVSGAAPLASPTFTGTVATTHNTLDDGTGNATIIGTLNVGGAGAPHVISVNGIGSGTGGGSGLYAQVGGNTTIAIGNYSQIIGGAYDATPVIFASSGLKTFVNGSVRSFLDGNGNLGLAVTPSAWDSNGNIELQGSRSITFDSSYGYINANAFHNGGVWKYVTSDYASGYSHGAGIHAWYTAPSGAAGSTITWLQTMTLDNSGNFMVGITTPYAAAVGGVSVGNFSLLQNASSNLVISNQSSGSSAAAALVLAAYGDDWTLQTGSTANNGNSLNFIRGVTNVAKFDTSNNFIVNATINTKGYTVSTLPSGTQGQRAFVTDATSPTFLGTLTGGGSVVCPVFYNGTAWVAG